MGTRATSTLHNLNRTLKSSMPGSVVPNTEDCLFSFGLRGASLAAFMSHTVLIVMNTYPPPPIHTSYQSNDTDVLILHSSHDTVLKIRDLCDKDQD